MHGPNVRMRLSGFPSEEQFAYWRTDQEAEIIATTVPPTDELESAIVRTLAPAAYTAIVRDVNATTGVALVEAYALN